MKKFKKFKEYDEEFSGDRGDHRHRLKEKHIRQALRSRDISQLIDIEEYE